MDKERCKDIIYDLKKDGTCFTINGGYLLTIPFHYRSSIPECVELLSRWRIENPSLSPQQFPVTNDRTERWLNACVLNNDRRVMFMIQNQRKINIGHIGLSEINYEESTIRIDSILRGVRGDTPGIISTSIEFLKRWCKNTLGAKIIDLIVLDDNYRAIELYQKCGFVYKRTIPLKKIVKNGEINWEEDYSVQKPEKKYINMNCYLVD